MIDRDRFFKSVRSSIFRGRLSQSQVTGMNRLLDVWENEHSRHPLSWLAYCLATVYHETATKMMPVREYGRGAGHEYGVPVNGKVYYGRGDVQLTWHRNYVRAGAKLGVPLADNPDLALEPRISARIMFLGMLEGWFTGKKLSDYEGDDFIGMRFIVNGKKKKKDKYADKAELIAGYAHGFLAALKPPPADDDEPDTPEPPPPDKVTTDKPLAQSKTLWSQITGGIAAAVGTLTPVVALIKEIEWEKVAVIATVALVALGIAWASNAFAIRERVRKMREEGV